MEWILFYFTIKYKNNFLDIYNALKNKEMVDPKEIEELEKRFKSGEIKGITILSKGYPEELKHIANPPFVIWEKEPQELIEYRRKVN